MEYWGSSYNFAVGDPHFANVSLLLRGDGANGSTAIIDSSPRPKIVTPVGDARISTTQSKFSNSSLFFDGQGDRLIIPGSTEFAFGTGDFTIEGWFYETARVVYASSLEIGDHLGVGGIIFLTNGGNNQPGNAGIYSQSGSGFVTSIAAGPLNTFNHIAWVRQSGQARTCVNGFLSPPVTFTANLTDISAVTVGSRSGGNVTYDFTGYINEFRVTKGVARYTANFTPPAAPFPDF